MSPQKAMLGVPWTICHLEQRRAHGEDSVDGSWVPTQGLTFCRCQVDADSQVLVSDLH